jgi:hypothetical protein
LQTARRPFRQWNNDARFHVVKRGDNPLGDQHLALAAEAAAVLFFGGWRLHHRAHPSFAPLIRQQHANQCFAVDPVSFCPPVPTGCSNRSRIDDMTFDPFILQHAIYPESVEASLLNDDERENPFRPRTPHRVGQRRRETAFDWRIVAEFGNPIGNNDETHAGTFIISTNRRTTALEPSNAVLGSSSRPARGS